MTHGQSTDATAMTKTRPLAYGALLRGDVVKILIGPDRTEYSVHSGILAHHSEYFKRALNGPWKEAEERVIELNDVECDIFELFLQWLYTQQYPKDGCFGNDYNHMNRLRRLQTCVFGDRFLIPAFRVAAESALIDSIIHEGSWYKTIIYAYEHLPSDSPILQALVDKHCYDFTDELDTEENGDLALRSELPHDFLVAVMLRYMRLRTGVQEEVTMDRCDYHQHEDDKKRGGNCKVPRIDVFDEDTT